MPWAIAIIFFLLWVLGMVTSFTLGGFIHVLIVTAVALLIVGAFKAGTKSEQRRGAARSQPSAESKPVVKNKIAHAAGGPT